MGNISIRGVLTTAVLVGALWAPASALAAVEKPGDHDRRRASAVQPTTAMLKGSVDPNGARDHVLLPGRRHPPLRWADRGHERRQGHQGEARGRRAASRPRSDDDLPLPARRRAETKGRSSARTARSRPSASRSACRSRRRRTRSASAGRRRSSGILSGTGNSGRQVQLQANPWPYTQGFLAVGNNVVTTATGGFSFTLLSVSVNTQYRVLMPAKPAVDEPDRRARDDQQDHAPREGPARIQAWPDPHLGHDPSVARRRARRHPEAAPR